MRLRHFACFCRPRASLATLRPAATRAMLCSCGQGEDGTGFLPFPLSWGPTEAERCRAGHGTSPADSLIASSSSISKAIYDVEHLAIGTNRVAVRSQGLGNDGARLHHDGARFDGA